jgi:hypothetical protein
MRRHHRQLDASIGASGPHDFAVRVSAVRQKRLCVHRIPPRVRDDREPPLVWNGMARDKPVIWVGCEADYFSSNDWTGQISLIRHAHRLLARRNHCRDLASPLFAVASLLRGEQTMPQTPGIAGETIEGVQHELLRTFPLKATSSGRSWEGVHISEFAEVYIEDLVSPPRDHVKIGLCTGTSPSIRREAAARSLPAHRA